MPRLSAGLLIVISWQLAAADDWACGPNKQRQIIDPSGTIKSPGFDGDGYLENTECQWLIYARNGQVTCYLS